MRTSTPMPTIRRIAISTSGRLAFGASDGNTERAIQVASPSLCKGQCRPCQACGATANDPALLGAMTITFTLSDAHGTEVLAVRARLPPGLPDHRPTKSGGRSSLANLGALVEAGYRLAPGAHRCRCAKGCRRRMHDVHAVPSDSQMATKILGRST